MSRSQFKKFAKPEIPVDNSDDEYELSIIYDGIISPFSELEISSSESEQEIVSSSEEISSTKNAKKERKKKNKQNSKKSQIDSDDDIDRSVREVNELLGEPSSDVTEPVGDNPDPLKLLFAVKLKHLNVSYERLKFPKPSTSSNVRKPFKKSHPVHDTSNPFIKRNAIIPRHFVFKSRGISMSVQRVEDDYTYFTFDHNREYQVNHREFVLHPSGRVSNPLIRSIKNMHVEGMLEGLKYFCSVEEYTEVRLIIEKIIAYMLYSAHPSFNLTNMKMRLEYKCVENRSFHVTVLLYIHFLSNRAYHRTALELAKMLLNLDPSDPLAVVFIIDILAIRAREYRWLVDAIDFMDKTRDLKYLPNIQFSYALAHFHIAYNGRECVKTADHHLRLAMMKFPSVLMRILHQLNHIPNASLRQHDYFNSYASSTTHKPLQDLIVLYASLIGERWKESSVLDWLLRNANEMIDLHDKDPAIKVEILNLEGMRKELFKSWPDQIYRHICIIQPLSKLLVNSEIPVVPGYNKVIISNPAPPSDSLDRYNYYPTDTNTNRFSKMFGDFLLSLSPED